MARRNEILEAIGSRRAAKPGGRRAEIKQAIAGPGGGVGPGDMRGLRQAVAAARDRRAGSYQGVQPMPIGPDKGRNGLAPQRPVRQRRVRGSSEAIAGPGVSQAEMPGLGRQLTRRVSSGAIDQSKAQRTDRERDIFQDAFGDDWRQQTFGDVGYMQRTRQALTKDPNNPELQALYANLMQRRQAMLKEAEKRGGQLGGASAV